MTDNEIIKGLECCGSPYNRCFECPLCEMERVKCSTELAAKALDLINRQKLEIKNLERIKDTIAILAVKEFAERLIKKAEIVSGGDYGFTYEITEDEIDNLVKEMVGAEQ